MNRISIAISILLVVALTGSLGAGSSQELDLETLMERKLDHTHALLEALIVEDFESLEESAEAIESLSHQAGWFVLQTPEYRQRSESFRAAVREVSAAAKARDLNGAALGYFDVTLNCIRCHALLRGTETAGALGASRVESPAPTELSESLRRIGQLQK